MLEVRYQNTVEDLRAAIRMWPRWQRLYWSLGWLVLPVLCGLPATLLFAMFGAWHAMAGGWLLMGVLALFIKYKFWIGHRAFFRALEQRLRPTTLRISPQRFKAESARGWFRCDWSAIDRVVAAPQYVYLVTNAQSINVVPRRAFESPAQAERFAQAAREYHGRASQSATTAPFTPGDPPFPANDALQVTYRNTPAELISIHFDSRAKNGRPGSNKFLWRLSMLFMVVGVAFAVLTSESDAVLQTLLGSAGFLFVAAAMFGAAHFVLRRLSRPMFEKLSQRERTVSISAAGVSLVEAHCEGFAMWEEFSSVEDDDRFLVLYQNNRSNVAFLIPKQAFASPGEADRFAGQAKNNWERVHAALVPELAVREETGNPYQAPAAR